MTQLDIATLEQQLATGIGQQETGNGTAGVGYTLNNPGAIKYAPWESQYGATEASSGFAQFPSLSQGRAAMISLIDQYIKKGSSLQSLIAGWAPPSDSNTNNPARVTQLAALTGLDPAQAIVAQSQPVSLSDTLKQILAQATAAPGTPPVVTAAEAAQAQIQAQQTSSSGGTIWGRALAGVAGVVCLLMGILLLRQTQIVIGQVGKVAEAAAVAV